MSDQNMQHLVKWEPIEAGVYRLRCQWCGGAFGETYVVEDMGEFQMGDGPLCTLGVQVADRIQTKDKLQ